jgi:hypothetical protein
VTDNEAEQAIEVHDDFPTPYVTIAERAELFGTTYREQLELELAQPWVKHWSTRFGKGAENLRAWIAAGRPAADRDRLCISGAPALTRAVRAVVAQMPEPAAWHIVETTGIACVAPGLGLTGPWPLPPTRPTTRIDMPFTDPGLIAHEIAHAWHRNPLMWDGLTSAQIDAVDDAIETLPGADARGERSDLSERAADALASLWVGRKVDTVSGRAGELRRAYRAEIAR